MRTQQAGPIFGLLALASLAVGIRAQGGRAGVDSAATDVVGGLSLRARAITCVNGGYFTTITPFVNDGRVVGMEICCNTEVFLEGLNSRGSCLEIGNPSDGFADETESCVGAGGISIIGFEAAGDASDVEAEPWAQLCSKSSCGVASLQVACGGGSLSSTHSHQCPAGSIIGTIYTVSDEYSVQGIPVAECRTLHPPASDVSSLFATDAKACGSGVQRQSVDLRCQGFDNDECGCLNVPALSPKPFHGCLLSGVREDGELPAVTLPEVDVNALLNDCQTDAWARGAPGGATGAWPWQQVKSTDGCLTTTRRDNVKVSDCEDVSKDPLSWNAVQQQWRPVDIPGVPYSIAESLAYPGMCVVIEEDRPASCGCADLALAARGLVAQAEEPEIAPEIAPKLIVAPPPEDPPSLPPPEPAPVPVQPPVEPPALAPEVEGPVATPQEVDPTAFASTLEPQTEPAAPIENEEPIETPEEFETEMPAEPVEPPDMPFETPHEPPVLDEPGATDAPEEPEAPALPLEYSPPEDEDEYTNVIGDQVEEDDDGVGNGEAVGPAQSQFSFMRFSPGRGSRAWHSRSLRENVCPPVDALVGFEEVGFEWVTVSEPKSPLLDDASALLPAVEAAGGADVAKTVLGAPEAYLSSLGDRTAFNPARVCEWRGVLCAPDGSGLVQVMAQGSGASAVGAALSSLPSLQALTVKGGDGDAAIPIPDSIGRELVALHVEGTSWQGDLPCSWAEARKLASLTVLSNPSITGPLPLCFGKFEPKRAYFDANREAFPLCGAQTSDTVLSAALPKCSDLTGVYTAAIPLAVELPSGRLGCGVIAEQLAGFFTARLGFAFETVSVKCKQEGAARRRLAQDTNGSAYAMVADVAGPAADVSLGRALSSGEEGNVLDAVNDDFPGGTSIVADVVLPPPGSGPDDIVGEGITPVGDGSDSGGDTNLGIIIGPIAGIALLIAVCVAGVFVYKRRRGKRDKAEEQLKDPSQPTYVSIDANGSDYEPETFGADLRSLSAHKQIPSNPPLLVPGPPIPSDASTPHSRLSVSPRQSAGRSIVRTGPSGGAAPPQVVAPGTPPAKPPLSPSAPAVSRATPSSRLPARGPRSPKPPSEQSPPDLLGMPPSADTPPPRSSHNLLGFGQREPSTSDGTLHVDNFAAQPGEPVLVRQASDGSDVSDLIEGGATNASLFSKSISKIKTSGSARRSYVPAAPAAVPVLPSSSDNYPQSADFGKMSSREIHRQLRDSDAKATAETVQDVRGMSSDKHASTYEVVGVASTVGDAHGSSVAPLSGPPSRSATPTPGGTPMSGLDAMSGYDGPSEHVNPAGPEDPTSFDRPMGGYVAAAVANVVPEPVSATPSGGYTGGFTGGYTGNSYGGGMSGGSAVGAGLSDPYAGAVPGLGQDLAGTPQAVSPFAASPPLQAAASVMEQRNGMALKAVTRRAYSRTGSDVTSQSPSKAFSTRLGNTFALGFTEDFSTALVGADMDGPVMERTDMATVGADDSGDLSAASRAMSVSSFTSVSVMMGRNEYRGRYDGDDVAKLEKLLNRVQRELGGQVGSFRLKGTRHRFAGRSSLVAFADGMHGGEFALKFYCDPEAAQTEFAIYRQAMNMHMALPPVHEIEDNTGGVIRLKDGTPLPPYLATPRGLPLPEWYATHRPRQVAVLTMLSQTLFRLERLHMSGYCHNDIKPANVVLLDSGPGRAPEWHIVDFTCIAQIGAQTRARYTLEYASPEVIRAVGAMRAHYVACRPSMDIWSMGVIVFEVLTGKAFFPMEYNREAMKDGLMGVEPLPVEEDPRLFSRIPMEAGLRQTVKAMLSRDTEKRPTAVGVGRVIRDCLKEITGEAPPTPQDMSPVSTIERGSSVAAGH